MRCDRWAEFTTCIKWLWTQRDSRNPETESKCPDAPGPRPFWRGVRVPDVDQWCAAGAHLDSAQNDFSAFIQDHPTEPDCCWSHWPSCREQSRRHSSTPEWITTTCYSVGAVYTQLPVRQVHLYNLQQPITAAAGAPARLDVTIFITRFTCLCICIFNSLFIFPFVWLLLISVVGCFELSLRLFLFFLDWMFVVRTIRSFSDWI